MCIHAYTAGIMTFRNAEWAYFLHNNSSQRASTVTYMYKCSFLQIQTRKMETQLTNVEYMVCVECDDTAMKQCGLLGVVLISTVKEVDLTSWFIASLFKSDCLYHNSRGKKVKVRRLGSWD